MNDRDDNLDQLITDLSHRWLQELPVEDEAAVRLRSLLEQASADIASDDPSLATELLQRAEAWSGSDLREEVDLMAISTSERSLDPLNLPPGPSADIAAALRPDHSASSIWGLDAVLMEHRGGAAPSLTTDQLAAVHLLLELHSADVVPARSIGWALGLVPDDVDVGLLPARARPRSVLDGA